MQIEVDVARWYDWRLKHHSEVQPGEVAIDSPTHGAGLKLVQELREEPSVTWIHIPDADIDRMVADHQEAVTTARQGYATTQEGGPLHGQPVTVAPRHLPIKSRDQLIADHLEQAVMPYHAPNEHVRAVRITEAAMPTAETTRLERYLNARLASGADTEPAPAAPEAQA
jgi:hypothetical protein